MPRTGRTESPASTAQDDEEAVLRRVVAAIEEPTRWCVEFGAWDGVHLSNTHHLVRQADWSAVLIEGDPTRFAALEANTADRPDVHAVRALVGWEGPERLDALLAATPVPEAFDLLSIDIDGNDFHVWRAVQDYRPRVVVIEYNPTIANQVDFVQERDPRLNQGASLRALTRLAGDKGYALAAVTATNAVFVVPEVLARLGVADNSLSALNPDEPWVTHVFVGFDGTVHLTGKQLAPWHVLPLSERRLQVVPRPLRRFPPSYGTPARVALAAYRPWAWLRADPAQRTAALRALPKLLPGRRRRS